MVEKEIPRASSRGEVRAADIREAYARHIQSFMKPWSRRRVVIDTANGMGGLEVPLVLEGRRVEWKGLFLDLDGSFPNHEANPLKDENVQELRAEVLRQRADVGFAFDGDADRCCVLNEKGERVGADLLTALLAREFLEKEPGAAIVYDLRSSRAVPEEIVRLRGRPIRERVGHSFIKATMRRENAPFAGELSGHFYFREHYFSDCATLAMVSVLNLMEKEQRPLSEIVAPLRRFHSSGEVNFEVEDKDAKIEELARRFQTAEQDRLDGITISCPDFWFNVRKSNTEPLLRLMLEASSKEDLDRRFAELCGFLGDPL